MNSLRESETEETISIRLLLFMPWWTVKQHVNHHPSDVQEDDDYLKGHELMITLLAGRNVNEIKE